MDYYVLLTGGKNNAGDFLIKHQAKKLLKSIRPDRELIDYNAWEPFDEKKLEVVNKSKALLLTGGPALRENMYPGIYKLVDDLDKIKVPIISFGIGWKSKRGDWESIYKYPLNNTSKKLLTRLSASGYQNSVRDYHSMHIFKDEGINNVVMTGCPALYNQEFLDADIDPASEMKKINFSLGVSFAKSRAMTKSTKKILLELKNEFVDSDLTVMFHHSIDKEYLDTPDPIKDLYYKNVEFAEWLSENDIDYKDISGSADDLIEEYSKADFHIGYRVHAHIFMSSVAKPSILIAEDGRGKALRSFLGGVVFDGFTSRKTSLILRGINKYILPIELFSTNKNLPKIIAETIDYEFKNGLPRLKATRTNINRHYPVMKNFVSQLP